jgi:hypothetical protein
MPRAPGPEESANTFIREKAPDIRPNPSPTVTRINIIKRDNSVRWFFLLILFYLGQDERILNFFHVVPIFTEMGRRFSSFNAFSVR